MLFVYRVTRVRVGVGARAYVNKVVEWETKKQATSRATYTK